MATPAHTETRQERAKEIPASDFQSIGNGLFLFQGKYETDGRNCHCGDNRFKRNDCIHAIRVRELFNLNVVSLVAVNDSGVSNVVQFSA
jgi:hypothetical protein